MKKKKNEHPFFDELDRLEQVEASLQTDLRNLLRKQGWRYTCNNPAFVWLMEKKLPDGRIVMVDPITASLFERHMCGEEEDE